MEKRARTSWRITKMLGMSGTIFIWLPILFMIVTGVVGSLTSQHLRMDFLIPAELFPMVLLGAVLLLFTATRGREKKKDGIIGLGLLLIGLLGSQGMAMATGLADGTQEPTGWRLYVVLGIYSLYLIGEVFEGVLGIKLLKKLSRKIDL